MTRRRQDLFRNEANTLTAIVVRVFAHSLVMGFPIVFFLLQMLAAIKFEDEPGLRGAKVRNIVSNSVLPSKGNSQLIIAYP